MRFSFLLAKIVHKNLLGYSHFAKATCAATLPIFQSKANKLPNAIESKKGSSDDQRKEFIIHKDFMKNFSTISILKQTRPTP